MLLRELCSVLPGALAAHIGDLIQGILYSLSEKNASSNMKIEALSFIHCLVTTHHPDTFHLYIKAEALNVLQDLVPQLSVLVKSPLLQGSALNALLNFFKAVVECNLPKLTYSHLIQIFLQLINTIGTGQCTIH
ncbi:hypothetical protein HHI36_016132 [Cryptolaemus montrouzieri]|uniref:Uncharacterized protein n=1 Tax=Cryptolaemus montrouzieri TaxID=559131 RepID=A0ABD2NIP4_9CUCU